MSNSSIFLSSRARLARPPESSSHAFARSRGGDAYTDAIAGFGIRLLANLRLDANVVLTAYDRKEAHLKGRGVNYSRQH
jgi:hypothetical protein